jgi:hypothetical protein
MLMGIIIGLLVGASITYNFILPANILDLRVVDITIRDLLRIIGGLVATGVATWVGAYIGGLVDYMRTP